MPSTCSATRPAGPVVALVAFTAVLIALLSPFRADAQAPRAERPTYKVGDRWHRTDGTYELKRIDTDAYVFVGDAGQEVHLTRDLVITKVVKGGVVEWEMSRPPKLKWPLRVGDWGAWTADLRSPRLAAMVPPGAQQSGPAMNDVSLVWKVESLEETDTAAGRFQAYRIAVHIPVASVRLLTVWYAPAIQRIVKAASLVEPVAFSLTGPSVATAQTRAPRAERPTYKIGDKWHRTDGTYELGRIDRDLYVFVADGGREVHLTHDLVIAKVVNGRVVEWELWPPPKLKWPLRIGDWGTTRGDIWAASLDSVWPSHGGSAFSGPGDNTARNAGLTWKVESTENVETPAGNFQAYVIAIEGHHPEGRRQPGRLLTIWYAPSTQSIVKVESRFHPLAFALAAVTAPGLGLAPKVAQPAPPTVAALVSAEADEYKEALRGFKETVGHRVAAVREIDFDLDRSRKVLAEIEQKVRPDLILAVGTWALQVVAGQTDIPVVYAMVLNPPSVVPPAVRNVTGASMNVPVDQSLRVLKQLGPHLKRVGVIFNRERTGYLVKQADAVARAEGLQLVAKEVVAVKDVSAALESLGEIDALWIVPDETVLVPAVVQQMLLFSYRRRIPVLGLSERHARMGALLSLSFSSSEDVGRQAGEIGHSILGGKGPSQIPYTTARKLHLVVNLRAAQKLGIEVPRALLGRATTVIEKE